MICAWMVTSSAVVGSSAISSRGSQTSAMAIMTRWRMPPDSWCGYSSTRRAGDGMPTCGQRLDRALARLLRADAAKWVRSVSPICSPTVNTGSSALIGSWKIMLICAAAHLAHLALGQLVSRSRPSNTISPVTLASRARQQAEDRQPGDGLAAAALADDADAVRRRVHRKLTSRVAWTSPASGAKVNAEAAHLQQRRFLSLPARFLPLLPEQLTRVF